MLRINLDNLSALIRYILQATQHDKPASKPTIKELDKITCL